MEEDTSVFWRDEQKACRGHGSSCSAMTEQIEQMGFLIETKQKQIDDLQGKYDTQLQLSTDLSNKLGATEKSLETTSKLLWAAKEDLERSHYNLKEKDYIISKHKKAESDLSHQAFVLRSDLEKSVRDNASLYSKLAREDRLSAANRSVVNTFQVDLANKVSVLCDTVVASTDQQKQHLQSVEKLCKSSLEFHDKTVLELKKKVSASRSLHVSYIEAIQNVVRLHKATTNASLDEISSLTSAGHCSFDQLLAVGQGEADLIFSDLQGTLASHRGEIANFTHELRERFSSSLEHAKEMSGFVVGLLDNLVEESKKLQTHSSQVHEARVQSISDFQRAYEEQTQSEAQKLISDMSNLVSSHISQQKELVEIRLAGLRDATFENKAFMDEYSSSMDSITVDAKRKWDVFSSQAEGYLNDGSNFTAVKHCRLDLLMQQCVNTADAASQQWKKTHASVGEMSRKHVEDMEVLVRDVIESNERHDEEVGAARISAENDVAKNSKDILQHFDGVMENERESSAQVLQVVEAQSGALQRLNDDHSSGASAINSHTQDTFQCGYTDYEPTGETPTRSEPDVPSKGTIEALKTMPMEELLEEFRESNPYEFTKERPSLIPRSPLLQLNRE